MALFKTLSRFLIARKTVITLLVVTALSCMLGVLIPQISYRGRVYYEQLHALHPNLYWLLDLCELNHVYSSVWFLGLVGLICLSLVCTLWKQFAYLLHNPLQRRPLPVSCCSFSTVVEYPEKKSLPELLGRIKRVLRSQGYRFLRFEQQAAEHYLVLKKNSAGRWGSAIFHLGLLCIVMAALFSFAFQKRGFVQIIHTEVFSGKEEDWLVKSAGVLAGEFDLGFRVRLDEFKSAYWDTDRIKTLESGLTFIDEKGEVRSIVSVGSPIHFKGIKIYQSYDYGFALGFALRNRKTEPALIHFCLDTPGRRDKPFVGEMRFPGTDYVLEIKFYPNLIEPSFDASFPGVDLRVTEKDEERFKGRLLLTQEAKLNGNTLAFAQLHYWSGLIFVKNWAISLIYWGFALSTVGAFLIFMLPYKEIHLKVSEKADHLHIALWGWDKRYKAIFSEEFKQLTDRLEKTLKVRSGNNRTVQI